jgi:hypothetical protein
VDINVRFSAASVPEPLKEPRRRIDEEVHDVTTKYPLEVLRCPNA